MIELGYKQLNYLNPQQYCLDRPHKICYVFVKVHLYTNHLLLSPTFQILEDELSSLKLKILV